MIIVTTNYVVSYRHWKLLWLVNPFLGSDRETNNKTTFAARQQVAARERLDKHLPTATDTHATIEVLLETGISTVVRTESL
jgi:hypothetical protein